MKVEHRQVGTVDVLTPIGALTEEDSESFCDALLDRVRSGNPRVVISMQDVPYLDSIALEGLLTAADELTERATDCKLVGVPPTCREIFELTGLAERFRFFKDVQDAVKSYL
ncbi:MAG: STAS domain-containing protein [Phycisphaerales bacterium]|nr:MAG: STAS domain-containing protein [Phycisphaerales bacterium]